MWIQPFENYTESALKIMDIENRKLSTSPKLDKQNMEGDEQPYASPEAFRSAMCTLLYFSNRMPEIQSTMRRLCKRLVNPTAQAGRQLVKLLKYLKGAMGMATFFPEHGVADRIEGYVPGRWLGMRRF